MVGRLISFKNVIQSMNTAHHNVIRVHTMQSLIYMCDTFSLQFVPLPIKGKFMWVLKHVFKKWEEKEYRIDDKQKYFEFFF